MKTKLILFAFFATLVSNGVFAQDKTTVTATNTDISDNLDLRAVASLFGDSDNLEDFERKLNDPKMQISNLDLNGDNEVDYLRVIESVEGNTHLIIIQSVLDKDVYQDVATVEVERDSNNNVQVQVVGDVYMYGDNYIYEPVYVHRPIIYDYFWVGGYQPYYSSWNWGYYPSYYSFWNPYPIYRYRNNVNIYINGHNHYNYVNTRRSSRAAALYNTRRSNGYEVRHPESSFNRRNPNVTNRHQLIQTRRSEGSGTRGNLYTPTRTSNENGGVRTSGNTRGTGGVRSSTPSQTRGDSSIKNTPSTGGTRNNTTRSQTTTGTTRTNNNVRTEPASGTTRSYETTRAPSPSVRTNTSVTPNSNSGVRTQSPARVESPSMNTRSASQTPRVSAPAPTRMETPRSNPGNASTPRQSAPRSEAPQGNGQQRSGRR